MADSDDQKKPGPHILADHGLGADLDHVHDGDADHDHDHVETDGPLEDNPLWQQDHVSLVSVGIVPLLSENMLNGKELPDEDVPFGDVSAGPDKLTSKVSVLPYVNPAK